jgi:hypothetical protein
MKMKKFIILLAYAVVLYQVTENVVLPALFNNLPFLIALVLAILVLQKEIWHLLNGFDICD